MENCQFCNISNHRIAADIIYESNLAMCFLDNRPISKGHSLVIAKEHFDNLYDIDDESLYEIHRVARLVSTTINQIYHPLGINVVQNNGEHAGQTIFHYHVHIIPRYDDSYNRALEAMARKRVRVDLSELGPVGNEIRSRLTP